MAITRSGAILSAGALAATGVLTSSAEQGPTISEKEETATASELVCLSDFEPVAKDKDDGSCLGALQRRIS